MNNYSEKITILTAKYFMATDPERMALQRDIHQLLQDAQRDIEKAYGGCRKCYGKGYSTVRHGLTGFNDFGGDGFESPIRTHMKFCTCDRGKQLESLQHPKDDKQPNKLSEE